MDDSLLLVTNGLDVVLANRDYSVDPEGHLLVSVHTLSDLPDFRIDLITLWVSVVDGHR